MVLNRLLPVSQGGLVGGICFSLLTISTLGVCRHKCSIKSNGAHVPLNRRKAEEMIRSERKQNLYIIHCLN